MIDQVDRSVYGDGREKREDVIELSSWREEKEERAQVSKASWRDVVKARDSPYVNA